MCKCNDKVKYDNDKVMINVTQQLTLMEFKFVHGLRHCFLRMLSLHTTQYR